MAAGTLTPDRLAATDHRGARREGGRALLLLYHGVGFTAPGGARRYTVARDQLGAHLALIGATAARRRMRVETLERWWWSGRRGDALILCFDDGGRSDYEVALPLLADAGLTATFFVNTARLGEAGFVNWSELNALQRAGMSVQSHAHEHAALTRLSPCALEESLRRSRHILQAGTGMPVHFLAAPFGFWNRRVRDAALATGYRALCTSRPGLACAGECVLPRNGMRADTSARQLQAWLHCRAMAFAGAMVRDRLLWMPKQMLLRCSGRWPQAAPARPVANSGSMS